MRLHQRHGTYASDVGPSEIEAALTAAETAVADGESLAGTGFWTAVAAVKTDPALVERHAGRIAAIDSAAFGQWALLVVPLALGTTLVLVATVAGAALIAWAYALEGWAAVIVFYLGVGALLVTTHGLGHLVVGRVLGIRFTNWFIGSIGRPQPGLKVDYAAYLRAPARARAWMHASGALITKLMPFLLIGAAVASDLPGWAVWILPAIGVATIVTDFAWSTSKSDWKRFRREMRHI